MLGSHDFLEWHRERVALLTNLSTPEVPDRPVARGTLAGLPLLAPLAQANGKRPSPAPLADRLAGLDVATRIGGLPPETNGRALGTKRGKAREFVLTLIANLQDTAGSPVVVVDLAEDFAKNKVQHTDVDYGKLSVVRTGSFDEGIEAARALLARADHEAGRR